MRYFLPIFVLFLVCSCKKKEQKSQAEIDESIIVKYISDHNLTATATGSGLYYVIDSQGTGAKPNPTSQVKVYYKGYFTSGSTFDECNTSGITFNLQNVIKGWTEGIPYFKKGGIGKLLIPSALAYGSQGTNGIPANSVLIFDIKLIDVY
ncbi:MAG: FKBP-type peptidyl-prolyl cis-trans isomerase [Flavobacteriia bacterium]|nr:FKBP-type peptidyl-prolyl cis-trans isomerase [Flavobacteriia bacterium]